MDLGLPSLLGNIYFIQGIGFIAFAFSALAFVSRSDRRLKKLLIGECIFLFFHFSLLVAHAAAGIVVISGFRNFGSLFGKIRFLAPMFILAYAVTGLYRYETWIDLLPVTAPAISTIGLFYMKEVPMRLTFLFAISLWIIHNAVAGSIGPLFMEIFVFSINFYRIMIMTNCAKKISDAISLKVSDVSVYSFLTRTGMARVRVSVIPESRDRREVV